MEVAKKIERMIAAEVRARTQEIKDEMDQSNWSRFSAGSGPKGEVHIYVRSRNGHRIYSESLMGAITNSNNIFGIECVALDNTTTHSQEECRAMIAGLRDCISVLEDRLEYILSLKQ